ncbi:MAG: ABC transporter permease [Bacteroides sp.]|nr:ABC transporter permease [Bacteroides sp.]
MIAHYLKVAVRNLLKYKTQSVISIVGLAIGLAFFTLSSLWMKYEMTFDAFHRDAERIYLVTTDDNLLGTEDEISVPIALGAYLKNNYQEIEIAAQFYLNAINIEHDGGQKIIYLAMADSATIDMFDIKLLEGNDNFYRLTRDKYFGCAISDKAAMELFGTMDVIGKKINLGNTECTIDAIVSSWNGHSHFQYHILLPCMPPVDPWQSKATSFFVKVKKGTDVEKLLETMNKNFPQEMKEHRNEPTGVTRFYLKPITKLRFDEKFSPLSKVRVIRSKYIVYFSLTGLLIILCALVNYLTVYADLFLTRSREVALRKVCGASEWALMKLFATEQLLVVLLSGILGMIMVELLLPAFLQYSQITETRDDFYMDNILFMAIMALVIWSVTLIGIFFVRRASLHHYLQPKRNSIARKCSIVVQLIVCLGFIASTTIMQMQLHYLRKVEVGFEYQNRGAVGFRPYTDMNMWYEKIKQLPMVEEVISPKYYPLVGIGGAMYGYINYWDGLAEPLKKSVQFESILASEEYFRFYNIELIAGEWINEKSGNHDILITESTARRMGWTPEEAVGKHYKSEHPDSPFYNVIGVTKDCAYRSPSADVPYTGFINTYHEYNQWFWERAYVLFKYKPGTWEACKKRIEEMQRAEAPNLQLRLYSEEEEFNNYLKSEDALSILLEFASLVCILISVFGIYSLITLTCERRRKEIAIRKVNGAKKSDILKIFVKDYTWILVIAAAIAFPISYIVMKQWLEGYNRQMTITLLPFALIFIGIALVVAITIGYRVWKTANENPADVVKSE